MAHIKILEEPFSRIELGEGRDYGIGFSLIKKVGNNKYQPLIPLSACKDYLNDIVHSEEYNSVHGCVYGFEYSHSNYFEKDNKHGYLMVAPVHYNNGEEWSKYGEAERWFFGNKTGILKVLRYFEDRLGLKRTEIFETTNYDGDKVFMFKFDRFWMKETILISLYTLLIRYYFNYTDKNISRKRLVEHKPFIDEDLYTFGEATRTNVIYNFKKLVYLKTKNYSVAQNFDRIHQVHNHGIVKGMSYLMENEEFNKN